MGLASESVSRLGERLRGLEVPRVLRNSERFEKQDTGDPCFDFGVIDNVGPDGIFVDRSRVNGVNGAAAETLAVEDGVDVSFSIVNKEVVVGVLIVSVVDATVVTGSDGDTGVVAVFTNEAVI
ncbi:hypothetical protein NDU88_006506 [Pleurodeles waltl]|uniref:Uncharacterized protein n=1 Tax=Pleurodeles waltl TaxID=8319 RepID=A0AAV7WAU1_PLEWA|nr:hypothetical protein NDU88_006506 [Pleurodeles waltl]